MDSWLVFRRNRVILNQWTKRNDWSLTRFSNTSFVRSFPIRQEILNVSQIAPFFIQTWLQQYCRRTFFHSEYCSLSNPICFRSVWCRRTMIPGFLSGSKNSCKLLCVSCEVFVVHGYDWIHWVAKSCTTTAYRWLFRDSQPSLRTLWSAVIKSPNFSARSTTPPMHLLHGALVILVLWQISQFRSFGKWV